MTFYSILALSSFMISLIGTRLTILAFRKKIAPSVSMLKKNRPVSPPRGGGIAVVMALIICLLVADMDYSIVLSIFILAALSLLNDILHLPLATRLIAQFVAVFITLTGMPDLVSDGTLPVWLQQFIIGVLWVWFINLFKQMDGIDGLSSTEMFCIGIGLCFPAVLAGEFPDILSIYGLIAAAAAFGFLWWSWHPAKILLGDVGTIPIGFLLGYLLLVAFAQGYHYTLFILPAYYISDASITAFKRFARGENILSSHADHYYQIAVRKGLKQEAVVRYIFGINLLLILLSTLSVLDPEVAIFHTAMAYLAVWMLLGFFAHTNEPR